MTATPASSERTDLIQTLQGARRFLRYTLRDLDDEQARRQTTVSTLCLGGLVKHVTAVERNWTRFIVEGAAATSSQGDGADQEHGRGFEMDEDDTVAGLLEEYQRVADATDRLVTDLPNLEATQLLPEAPWFPPGASWSARMTLLHIVAETSQHSGHADIIRESLDGAKTMG